MLLDLVQQPSRGDVPDPQTITNNARARTVWRSVLITRQLGAFLQLTHVLAQAVAERLGGDGGGNSG
jgi:hypothetical protein